MNKCILFLVIFIIYRVFSTILTSGMLKTLIFTVIDEIASDIAYVYHYNKLCETES